MSDQPQTAEWRPVTSLADLDKLDELEVKEGYFDGRDDAPEPRPGGNRSRAYWHGWRVGMMDAGKVLCDQTHAQLVRDWLARERSRRAGR